MHVLHALIVGDSRSLPRDEVAYHDTWVHHLRKNRPDLMVSSRSEHGATTDWLQKKSSLEWFSPDLVILQLGLVDCAPRVLSLQERRILGALPDPWSRGVGEFAKRLRSRHVKRAYVDESRFRSNVSNYLERAAAIGALTCIIRIGVPGDDLVRRCPGIVEAIARYNAIYESTVEGNARAALTQPLDPTVSAEDRYIHDGYHLNPHGAAEVYEAVDACLRTLQASPARERGESHATESLP